MQQPARDAAASSLNAIGPAVTQRSRRTPDCVASRLHGLLWNGVSAPQLPPPALRAVHGWCGSVLPSTSAFAPCLWRRTAAARSTRTPRGRGTTASAAATRRRSSATRSTARSTGTRRAARRATGRGTTRGARPARRRSTTPAERRAARTPSRATYYITTANAKVGDLGSEVLPPRPTGTVWRRGATVKASFTINANHGGGRAVRVVVEASAAAHRSRRTRHRDAERWARNPDRPDRCERGVKLLGDPVARRHFLEVPRPAERRVVGWRWDGRAASGPRAARFPTDGAGPNFYFIHTTPPPSTPRNGECSGAPCCARGRWPSAEDLRAPPSSRLHIQPLRPGCARRYALWFPAPRVVHFACFRLRHEELW